MKRFNPDKELYKIQHGNQNKVIFGVITLLFIIAVGSSYALYQIRYSKRIIYTKVGEFYQNDVVLSVYIDGEKKIEPNSFPDKDSGKIFSHVTCKNGGTGYFDNTKWELNLKTTEQDRCDVYFVTGNLPNEPELYQGMIPVVYGDTGIMYVADTNSDWYNYQDHRWANAVLVDASNETIKNKYFKEDNQLREDIAGKEVPMEEVLQMYVWIPRYKYQLFNVNNEGVPKQIINIKFENGTENTGDIKCTYTDNNDGTITERCVNKEGKEASNGEWYTHPAFTFKGTFEESGSELRGIWIGKFEPSDPTDINGRTNGNKINEITILPNKTSMVFKTLATIYNAGQELSKVGNKYNLKTGEVDNHPMKNIDWGAIAYLSQSVYGIYKDEKTCNIEGMGLSECKIWKNNIAQGIQKSEGGYTFGGTYTGCAGESVDASLETNTEDGAPAKCPEKRRWNKNGVKASTTGNLYGVYDMVGGAREDLMGLTVDSSGELLIRGSGFISDLIPKSEYYDVYVLYSQNNKIIGHLGDATKEVAQCLEGNFCNWNDGLSVYPTDTYISRGSKYDENSSIFSSHRGYSTSDRTIRVVLTAA